MNKMIIQSIGAAGLLATALVAPNVVSALKKSKFLPQERQRVNGTLNRMIANGYVVVEKKNGEPHVRLTKKGEAFAMLMADDALMPKKPARWDGKWRIVTYDLPGKATKLRGRIRELLRAWGFTMLQQSIWIYPYDCEELIFILKQEYKLGKGLLYIIADEVENDSALRAHFKLSKA